MEILKGKLKKIEIPMLDINDSNDDPVMKAKLTIEGLDNWVWYIAAWDKESYCFGYVVGLFPDLGFYDLEEVMNTAHYDELSIKVEEVNIPLSELS